MEQENKLAKQAAIEQLKKDIEKCAECLQLKDVGKRPVFPRGNPDAICMIVGEGPGEQEEKQQKPFVGAAGKLLEETLKKLGFVFEQDFYITNIVKYRAYKMLPSGKKSNKPPTAKQVEAEKYLLKREIDILKPKLIVTLGAKASQWFLGKDFKLTAKHGKFYDWNGIKILPTYHPAAILRAFATGNSNKRKKEFEEDLEKIREFVKHDIKNHDDKAQIA